MTEILEELHRLARADRETVRQRLEALELEEIEESPEMLAAIDAGRHSMQQGKGKSIAQARELLAQWTSKKPGSFAT